MVDVLTEVGSLSEFAGLAEVCFVVRLPPCLGLAVADFSREVGSSGYVLPIVHWFGPSSKVLAHTGYVQREMRWDPGLSWKVVG